MNAYDILQKIDDNADVDIWSFDQQGVGYLIRFGKAKNMRKDTTLKRYDAFQTLPNPITTEISKADYIEIDVRRIHKCR